jgi:hypothetical protein
VILASGITKMPTRYPNRLAPPDAGENSTVEMTSNSGGSGGPKTSTEPPEYWIDGWFWTDHRVLRPAIRLHARVPYHHPNALSLSCSGRYNDPRVEEDFKRYFYLCGAARFAPAAMVAWAIGVTILAIVTEDLIIGIQAAVATLVTIVTGARRGFVTFSATDAMHPLDPRITAEPTVTPASTGAASPLSRQRDATFTPRIVASWEAAVATETDAANEAEITIAAATVICTWLFTAYHAEYLTRSCVSRDDDNCFARNTVLATSTPIFAFGMTRLRSFVALPLCVGAAICLIVGYFVSNGGVALAAGQAGPHTDGTAVSISFSLLLSILICIGGVIREMTTRRDFETIVQTDVARGVDITRRVVAMRAASACVPHHFQSNYAASTPESIPKALDCRQGFVAFVQPHHAADALSALLPHYRVIVWQQLWAQLRLRSRKHCLPMPDALGDGFLFLRPFDGSSGCPQPVMGVADETCRLLQTMRVFVADSLECRDLLTDAALSTANAYSAIRVSTSFSANLRRRNALAASASPYDGGDGNPYAVTTAASPSPVGLFAATAPHTANPYTAPIDDGLLVEGPPSFMPIVLFRLRGGAEVGPVTAAVSMRASSLGVLTSTGSALDTALAAARAAGAGQIGVGPNAQRLALAQIPSAAAGSYLPPGAYAMSPRESPTGSATGSGSHRVNSADFPYPLHHVVAGSNVGRAASTAAFSRDSRSAVLHSLARANGAGAAATAHNLAGVVQCDWQTPTLPSPVVYRVQTELERRLGVMDPAENGPCAVLVSVAHPRHRRELTLMSSLRSTRNSVQAAVSVLVGVVLVAAALAVHRTLKVAPPGQSEHAKAMIVPIVLLVAAVAALAVALLLAHDHWHRMAARMQSGLGSRIGTATSHDDVSSSSPATSLAPAEVACNLHSFNECISVLRTSATSMALFLVALIPVIAAATGRVSGVAADPTALVLWASLTTAGAVGGAWPWVPLGNLLLAVAAHLAVAVATPRAAHDVATYTLGTFVVLFSHLGAAAETAGWHRLQITWAVHRSGINRQVKAATNMVACRLPSDLSRYPATHDCQPDSADARSWADVAEQELEADRQFHDLCRGLGLDPPSVATRMALGPEACRPVAANSLTGFDGRVRPAEATLHAVECAEVVVVRVRFLSATPMVRFRPAQVIDGWITRATRAVAQAPTPPLFQRTNSLSALDGRRGGGTTDSRVTVTTTTTSSSSEASLRPDCLPLLRVAWIVGDDVLLATGADLEDRKLQQAALEAAAFANVVTTDGYAGEALIALAAGTATHTIVATASLRHVVSGPAVTEANGIIETAPRYPGSFAYAGPKFRRLHSPLGRVELLDAVSTGSAANPMGATTTEAFDTSVNCDLVSDDARSTIPTESPGMKPQATPSTIPIPPLDLAPAVAQQGQRATLMKALHAKGGVAKAMGDDAHDEAVQLMRQRASRHLSSFPRRAISENPTVFGIPHPWRMRGAGLVPVSLLLTAATPTSLPFRNAAPS